MVSKIVDAPRLLFTPEAWMRLQMFLHRSELEISGFGRLRSLGNDFLCEQIIVLDQEVSAAEAVIDPIVVGKFITDQIEQGGDPSVWKLWWHSHAKMSAFWSTTDDTTMGQLAADSGWMFGLVGNQKGIVKIRMDLAHPAISLNDLEHDIWYFDDSALADQIDVEIAMHVRKKAPAPTRVLISGGNNAGSKKSVGLYRPHQRQYLRAVAAPHDPSDAPNTEADSDNLEFGFAEYWFD